MARTSEGHTRTPTPRGFYHEIAKGFVKPGMIVDASTEFSVVKILFDEEDVELTFTKDMLYSFGIKCEGDMANILEPETEAIVRFKVDDDRIPYVVTVWIGDKPEDPSKLKRVFDQPGRLTVVEDGHFLVKSKKLDGKVLVRKSVVYRYGCLLDEDRGPVLIVGENIRFDAVPLLHNREPGMMSHLPTHSATCAWLDDLEPRLVDRFGLAEWNRYDDVSEKDLDLEGTDVEGIVTVVPNDTVAFVDVDLGGLVLEVLLFRSCFESGKSVASQSLRDLVAADDMLRLLIRRGCLYSGRKHWFATKAWKICDEVPEGEIAKRPAPEIERGEHLERFAFIREPVFTGLLRVLNCRGTMTSAEVYLSGEVKNCLWIDTSLGTSTPMEHAVVSGVNDNFTFDASFLVSNFEKISIDVWFDAIVSRHDNNKLSFYVERIWKHDESGDCQVSRLAPEVLLAKKLSYKGDQLLVLSEVYVGTIKSLPFYDCAIVDVGEIPVLVTLESLVADKKVDQNCTTIDLFLKVGQKVVLRAYEADGYYRATECWSLYDGSTVIITNNVYSNGSSSLSVQSWKSDDFYGKSIVMRMKTKYTVAFTAPPQSNLTQPLVLDLFGNRKVFAFGGFITSLREADELVGRHVSFYVAYSPEKENAGTPYGLYVAYAWAGLGSVPWAALDDRLPVPKGVLCSNWVHIGVVECLPESNRRGVPQHIVCSIGPLPVLVKTIADGENAFEEGESVRLNVQEENHWTVTALVSSIITRLDVYNHVLRFKGTVAIAPEPSGLITTVCGVEVIFHLCHVQDRAVFGCDGKELLAWTKRVTKATRVGANVYFTAHRVGDAPTSYRALEVWPSGKGDKSFVLL